MPAREDDRSTGESRDASLDATPPGPLAPDASPDGSDGDDDGPAQGPYDASASPDAGPTAFDAGPIADASTGDAAVEPYPDCARDTILEPPPYDGPIAMTREALSACLEQCPPISDCLEESCPGFAAYRACVETELIACSAARAGACRKAFEQFACCQLASPCDGGVSCVAEVCATEAELYAKCLTDDSVCLEHAGPACLVSDEPDGGQG